MYKFIKMKDLTNQFDIAEISMSVDALTTDDIVTEFKYFLLGCGFHPNSIKSSFESVASELEEEE